MGRDLTECTLAGSPASQHSCQTLRSVSPGNLGVIVTPPRRRDFEMFPVIILLWFDLTELKQ